MNNQFEHISFDDSYILGWEKKSDKLIFYVNLLLTEGHRLFKPYDKKTEHGCYRRGSIILDGLVSMFGLPCDKQPMMWNDDIKEYDDIAEIDSLIVTDDQRLIIDADEYVIEAKAKKINICFSSEE